MTVSLVAKFQTMLRLNNRIHERFMTFCLKRNFFNERMALSRINKRSSQIVLVGEEKVIIANFEDVESTPLEETVKRNKLEGSDFEEPSWRELDEFYIKIHSS